MAKKNRNHVNAPTTLKSICKRYKITLDLCGGFFKEDIDFNPEQIIPVEDKHLVRHFLTWCEHCFNIWTDSFEDMYDDDGTLADKDGDAEILMSHVVANCFNEAIANQKYIIMPLLFQDGYDRLCKVFEGQFEVTSEVKKVMLLAVLDDLKSSNKHRLLNYFDVK